MDNVTIVLRSELNKKYNINKNTWTRYHDRLMEHLQEYIDIEEVKTSKGRFEYHVKGELPKNIPPLPRKNGVEEKELRYHDFTLASVGAEFKPNSASRIARDAIYEFGYRDYMHTSEEAVSRRYIRPVMREKATHSATKVWVYYQTYEIIEDDVLQEWFRILEEEHITEKDMAEAFIKEQQGEDITKERNYYKRAIDRFKNEFGSIPIKVYEWKIKTEFLDEI